MSSEQAVGTNEPKSRDSESRDDEPRESVQSGSWLLLTGNRLHVAGLVLAGVLVALLALLWTFGFPAVQSSSPMFFLFSSLVTGDLTLVTVVLSINQLVLSRELGEPGRLSDRIRGTLDYRDEVEEATETPVTPKSPSHFLRFLHETVEAETDRLADAATDAADSEVRDRVSDLVGGLDADVKRVRRSIGEADGDIFGVVSATLATNHASQLHEIYSIRDEYGDALSGEVRDALDAIETQLLQIDVARQYFKTVYVQKELASLSRIILYVGVPAVAFDCLALVFYNVVGAVPVSPYAVYAVASVAVTVGLAPLAVLFAYVLRLAWVAQRTTTVVPFSSEGQFRS